MTKITREALAEWAKGYVDYWNAGEKEAWIENWKKIAPGDFVMYDPVGTPPKIGFQAVALDAYDLFQPTTRLKPRADIQYICGNEVAWVMENTFSKDGEESHMRSIEVYSFSEDGSVEIKTHYDVPDASDPISGHLFSEYLPDED